MENSLGEARAPMAWRACPLVWASSARRGDGRDFTYIQKGGGIPSTLFVKMCACFFILGKSRLKPARITTSPLILERGGGVAPGWAPSLERLSRHRGAGSHTPSRPQRTPDQPCAAALQRGRPPPRTSGTCASLARRVDVGGGARSGPAGRRPPGAAGARQEENIGKKKKRENSKTKANNTTNRNRQKKNHTQKEKKNHRHPRAQAA